MLKQMQNPEDLFIKCNSIFVAALTEKKLALDEGSFNREEWEKWFKANILKAIGNDGEILQKWLDHEISKVEKELSELKRIQTITTKGLAGEYGK